MARATVGIFVGAKLRKKGVGVNPLFDLMLFRLSGSNRPAV
jgi:hypothetical protein